MKGKAAIVDILETGVVRIGDVDRGYALMPFCKDGSVASYDLRNNAEEILRITAMTARNIGELHKVGLLHKDIKPENILYTDKDSGLAVISDFGIADVLGDDGSVNTPQSRTVIYAAPEALRQHHPHRGCHLCDHDGGIGLLCARHVRPFPVDGGQ